MIIRHPAFPEVEKRVDDPEPWVRQGWVAETPPLRPKPRPRRKSKYPRI